MAGKTKKKPSEEQFMPRVVADSTVGLYTRVSSKSKCKGVVIPRLKKCYLCKRKENQLIYALLPDGTADLSCGGGSGLSPYQVSTADDLRPLLYWLCYGCSDLLKGASDLEYLPATIIRTTPSKKIRKIANP